MPQKNLSQTEVKSYLSSLISLGPTACYNQCVENALLKIKAGEKNIDIILLDLSISFLETYRKNNDEQYFTISKILRRCAHYANRQLHKKIKNPSPKFLRLIKG